MAVIDEIIHLHGTKDKLPDLPTGRMGFILDSGQEQIVFGTPRGNVFVPSQFNFDTLKQEIANVIGDTNNLTTINKVIVNAINELNAKGGIGGNGGGFVDYTTYTYTATADNTSTFDIVNNGIYDPIKDTIQMFKDGILLEPTKNYTLSGLTVTLTDWVLNTNDSIYMLIYKVSQMTGEELVDGTVTKAKLETSVQNTLTNADKIGDLTTLQTTDKTSIVNAINENSSQLKNNTNNIPKTCDTNILYNRALVDISKNMNLNSLKMTEKALSTGIIKVAFVGDSITEGIDQVVDDDKYANKLINALQKTIPNVTITWTNFGLNGRGISQFNDDNYVASNPETNYLQNFWRSWSVVGKSWRQHVKDFNPDLIIFAFGMNDVGTNILANQGEYNNLLIAQQYFNGFSKTPDIVLIPTYLPTKDQNQGEVPWFTQTQEATLSVARATREFGKQYNYPIIDVNRTFCLLRDGIDQDGFYGYIDGLNDNLIGDTSQFTIGASTVQAKSGATKDSKVYSDATEFYNGDISCDITLESHDATEGVAQLFYRWKDDRGGYLLQLAPNTNGNCEIDMFSFVGGVFNTSTFKKSYIISSAITTTTTINVKIKVRGARHIIYVNNIVAIDIYDYDRLANGYVGVCTNGTTYQGIVNNLTVVYFIPYQTNIGLYSEDKLLGVNYNNDPQSGNAVNHLSGLGYSLVYEPILFYLAEKIGILNNKTNNKKVVEVCDSSQVFIVGSSPYWDTQTTDGKNIYYYTLQNKTFDVNDVITALDLTSFKTFNLNNNIENGLQLHTLQSGQIAYLKSQPTDNKALIFIREDDKPVGKLLININ